MYRFFTKKITRAGLATLLCLTLTVQVLVMVPINHKGELQEAHALVVFDPKNAVLNKINIAVNTVTKTLQNAFYIKEFTLDGIAYGLAKMVIKSMTQSIVNWINSGFQGSPAFVTDLQQYLRDQVDRAIGDFIYNDPDLNFLCSPFQLDVKIALATSYQSNAYGGYGSKAQCTLSDVTDNIEGFLNGSFNDGGWQGWFEITQNYTNTPVGAELSAKTEMYARIVDAQGREIQQLNWGDGFLSFKVCADTAAQKNCDITTPGRVIADQINKSLGAGQDALITADEINEILSALFAQLAKQALTGINGLLGLGGSSYSSGGFGSLGNQSFLDALADETTDTSGITNPFPDALDVEAENSTQQQRIINKVDAIETEYNAAVSTYGSCIDFSFSNSFITARDEAEARIVLNNQHIVTLTAMNTEFTNTTDLNRMNELVVELNSMQQNGELTSLTENELLKVDIDFDLTDSIAAFSDKLDKQKVICSISIFGR